MTKDFNITGYYYQIKEHTFRKFLNIKKKNTKLQKPDIMIVMMNPGGSQPKNGNHNGCTETEAVPDRTQDQVMKVLQNCNFEYARILNLSDYCHTESNEFYKMIPKLHAENIPHSIFDDTRKNDFNKLWVPNIPVIYAWGVDTKLKPLALKAIKTCNIQNPYGHQKPNFPWAYYHPLPPNTHKQKEWVQKISALLK